MVSFSALICMTSLCIILILVAIIIQKKNSVFGHA